MSAALEHPMTDPLMGPYTIEDWLAMENPADGSRLELIFGYRHVTPAPSGEHQTVELNLAVLLKQAIRAAGRKDLHVVTTVNVRISNPVRTGLIPDLVVLNRKAVGVYFGPEDLELVVEVWSPGNPRKERETKLAGYALAGVPFVWTVDQGNDLHGLTLTALRLEGERYVVENKIEAEGPVSITAAPVPVEIDLAALLD